MRFRSLAVNILLPAGIAIAIVAAWVWWTGSATMSIPVVVGLALVAGGVSLGAERLLEVVAVRRRARPGPARHRSPHGVATDYADRLLKAMDRAKNQGVAGRDR